jgi:hypothetical protein
MKQLHITALALIIASLALITPASAAVSGAWVLHYSWGCTSSYSTAPITFNPGNPGTLTSGGGNSGKWWQQDGTIIWKYDNGPANYGGNITGNDGSGVSSTYAGLNGCWYLLREGTVGLTASKAQETHAEGQTHDAAGNTRK